MGIQIEKKAAPQDYELPKSQHSPETGERPEPSGELKLIPKADKRAGLAFDEPPQTQGETTLSTVLDRRRVTPFGTYWITSDSKTPRFADDAEVISESDFHKLQQVWRGLKDGRGSLQIGSALDDSDHDPHKARATLLAAVGKLMSKPLGRKIVLEVVNSNREVFLSPASGGAAVPFQGFSLVLLSDQDPLLHITIGHELIHVLNVEKGRARPRDPHPRMEWTNYEERQTIWGSDEAGAFGELSDNNLREEWGIEPRYDHLDAQDPGYFHSLNKYHRQSVDQQGAQKFAKSSKAFLKRFEQTKEQSFALTDEIYKAQGTITDKNPVLPKFHERKRKLVAAVRALLNSPIVHYFPKEKEQLEEWLPLEEQISRGIVQP